MKRLLLVAASLAMIAPSAVLADADPALGSAVRVIVGAEVIDPHPQYRSEPPPTFDGVRAVRGIVRFQLDRLKPLIIPTSSTKTGAQGSPVNGSGEILNGSDVGVTELDGDKASTGSGGSGGGGSSGSSGGPAASH